MSIRIKPGETLRWVCVDDSGDLTGTTIEAAVRFGDFYYQLTVTEDDLSAGQYTISAASTANYPLGRLDCDIKYTSSGVVTFSQTFPIYVEKQVTR